MKLRILTLLPILGTITGASSQTPLSANEALTLAARNRPTIQAAKLGIEQAKFTGRAQSALPATTIGIGASTRSDVGATDQDLFISQPIDAFGRQREARRLSHAYVQLAALAYQQAAMDLQTEVLTTFSAAVAARKRADVANELLIIADGLLTATKRRFDEGKVAQLQVTRANLELGRAKQSAIVQAANYSAAVTRLAGNLGEQSPNFAIDAEATIEPLLGPGVASRPEILILAAQVQLAVAEAEVARSQHRPDLNLQLVRSPWDSNRGYFVGRAQLTWPIFDHGRSRAESKAARLKQESGRKDLADAIARAEAELASIKIELTAHQAQVKGFEAILAGARDLVAKSQRAYAEGFGTQVEVLEASRALREVELDLVEVQAQVNLSVISQYRASGYLAEVLK